MGFYGNVFQTNSPKILRCPRIRITVYTEKISLGMKMKERNERMKI